MSFSPQVISILSLVKELGDWECGTFYSSTGTDIFYMKVVWCRVQLHCFVQLHVAMLQHFKNLLQPKPMWTFQTPMDKMPTIFAKKPCLMKFWLASVQSQAIQSTKPTGVQAHLTGVLHVLAVLAPFSKQQGLFWTVKQAIFSLAWWRKREETYQVDDEPLERHNTNQQESIRFVRLLYCEFQQIIWFCVFFHICDICAIGLLKKQHAWFLRHSTSKIFQILPILPYIMEDLSEVCWLKWILSLGCRTFFGSRIRCLTFITHLELVINDHGDIVSPLRIRL